VLSVGGQIPFKSLKHDFVFIHQKPPLDWMGIIILPRVKSFPPAVRVKKGRKMAETGWKLCSVH